MNAMKLGFNIFGIWQTLLSKMIYKKYVCGKSEIAIYG